MSFWQSVKFLLRLFRYGIFWKFIINHKTKLGSDMHKDSVMYYSFSHNIIYNRSAAFFIAYQEVHISETSLFSTYQFCFCLQYDIACLSLLSKKPDMKSELDSRVLLSSYCFHVFLRNWVDSFFHSGGYIKFFIDITQIFVYQIPSSETTFSVLLYIVYSIAFGISSNKK